MDQLETDPKFDKIRVEVVDGVVDAAIDNGPINLIDRSLFRELRKLPSYVVAHPEARVLHLRSANPKFFLAHFDVELILASQAAVDSAQPIVKPESLHGFHQMCEDFRQLPIPTICEISGRVGGGGGELAASCDMRFGAIGKTILCQMEVPLGILPGGSGTQRLPSMVGRGRALEIVLSGDDVDGATLERWGWLNRALAPEALAPFVKSLVQRLAAMPADAVRLAKQSVLAAMPDPTPGLLNEAFLFDQTLRYPESKQRMESFLAKGGQTIAGEMRVGDLGAELG